MMQTTEDIFYRLGKIILLPGILGAIFLRAVGREGLTLFPDCQFRRFVGIYCPGCGGTRAAYYLAGGHVAQAFLCHPVVPYIAAVYLIFMVTCFYRRRFSRKSYRPIKIERYAYVSIAIILLQWVTKNVLLFGFGISWI